MPRLRSKTTGTSGKKKSAVPARGPCTNRYNFPTVATATLTARSGKTTTYNVVADELLCFLHVVQTRLEILEARSAGRPPPYTKEDDLMNRLRMTNIDRADDRFTQHLIMHVMEEGPKTLEEISFRIMLATLFGREETYSHLESHFGGPPSWKGFNIEAYVRALEDRRKRGNVYGGAYQMFAPQKEAIGSGSSEERTLRLLSLMMQSRVWERLGDAQSLQHRHAIIASYPTLGGFLGCQYEHFTLFFSVSRFRLS